MLERPIIYWGMNYGDVRSIAENQRHEFRFGDHCACIMSSWDEYNNKTCLNTLHLFNSSYCDQQLRNTWISDALVMCLISANSLSAATKYPTPADQQIGQFGLSLRRRSRRPYQRNWKIHRKDLQRVYNSGFFGSGQVESASLVSLPRPDCGFCHTAI